MVWYVIGELVVRWYKSVACCYFELNSLGVVWSVRGGVWDWLLAPGRPLVCWCPEWWRDWTAGPGCGRWTVCHWDRAVEGDKVAGFWYGASRRRQTVIWTCLGWSAVEIIKQQTILASSCNVISDILDCGHSYCGFDLGSQIVTPLLNFSSKPMINIYAY